MRQAFQCRPSTLLCSRPITVNTRRSVRCIFGPHIGATITIPGASFIAIGTRSLADAT